MCVRGRHLLLLASALVVLTRAHIVRAWVELAVESDVVTVEVQRTGRAHIHHELIVRVRGGPLRAMSLQGVDADAEPTPGATVARALSHGATQREQSVLVHRADDASLRLEIDDRHGLRRGTHIFRFSYRTDSILHGLRPASGPYVTLQWVGPRFESGIDLAKVIFRIPKSGREPRLPTFDQEGVPDPLGVHGETTVVSTVRRGADHDELELVRPYVARGEPVVWTAQASTEAFDIERTQSVALPAAPPPRVEFESGLYGLWLGPSMGLLFAGAVLLKHRTVRRACRSRGSVPRTLVPWPPGVLALISGALLGGSVIAGAYFESWPTLVVLAIAAMLAPVHVASVCAAVPRGPGRWLPLTPEDAFRCAPSAVDGWFDAGTRRGLTTLGLCVMGITSAACLVRAHPPGVLTLLVASVVLVPLLFTGRAAHCPPDPAVTPRPLLKWLFGRLRKDSQLRVVPWARIPDRVTEPDELRLLVLPSRPREGLVGIEVACEYYLAPGGYQEVPCVVVRATDHSPSHLALPRSVLWTRGRSSSERIAVLRPALPVRGLVLSLVRRVARDLSDAGPARCRQGPSSRRAMSEGSSACAAKAATTVSPAHAT